MLDSSPAAAPTESQQPPRRHGPGRPFEKGRSGNAAGRSTKPPDIGELARRYARRAVQALVRQLGSNDAQAAVNAAQVLLAHGYGEPVQHHAMYVPRISIVCTNEPEARANGADDQPGRWDA
jgi:hypothetical protein